MSVEEYYASPAESRRPVGRGASCAGDSPPPRTGTAKCSSSSNRRGPPCPPWRAGVHDHAEDSDARRRSWPWSTSSPRLDLRVAQRSCVSRPPPQVLFTRRIRWSHCFGRSWSAAVHWRLSRSAYTYRRKPTQSPIAFLLEGRTKNGHTQRVISPSRLIGEF